MFGSLHWGHAQPSCVTAPPGLIGWWKGENNANDSFGTNNATLEGGVEFTNGEVGQGFLINGSANDYVALPTNVFPFPTTGTSTMPFSFEVWFKTTSGGVILGQQDTAPFTGMSGWVPGLYVGTNGLLYGHLWEGVGMPPFPSSTNQVNDGKFHHAAVTYDGTNEALYLDGVDITNMPFTQKAYASGTYYYQLGTGYTAGWPGTSGDWFSFDGVIDEASIYNRALTAAEVASIFTAGSAGKCVSASTQSPVTNYWTNTTSGYWEQPYWSMGVLPGTNQNIAFTNAWQALAIGPSTVESAPGSLNVQSITLEAPTNSVNVLLLNYAGIGNPLQIGTTSGSNAYLGKLLVGSNSSVFILNSALQVNNAPGTGNATGAFSVGGTVNQDGVSLVTAGFMRLGDFGPGVYNLTNGSVSMISEYLGSVPTSIPASFPGTFNQFGGSNSAYLQIGSDSQYNLHDGVFNGTLALWNGANFNQYGGSVTGVMHLVAGNYLLAGGTLDGANLVLPDNSPPGPMLLGQYSSFVQTGGTNSCSSLELYGTDPSINYPGGALGTYSLSNGTLWVAGPVTLLPPCTFNQSGGIFVNAGLSMSGAESDHGPVFSSMNLDGGVISSAWVTVTSSILTQVNGTNQVSGNVLITGGGEGEQPGTYILSGGLLVDSNAIVSSALGGGFVQTGGTHLVGNQFTINGTPELNDPESADFASISGGALSAPIIEVDGGNSLLHSGGSITNGARLILNGGTWTEQTSGQHLGALQLGPASKSYLALPAGNPCVVQFADSSSLTWSNQSTLNIQNWNGSLNGSGRHQIIFGSSAQALTAPQLSRIFFINPAGVSGTFPASILSSGEIVPGQVLLARASAGSLVLQWPRGANLQTATNLGGPWQDLGAATSPYTNTLSGPARFFRVHP